MTLRSHLHLVLALLACGLGCGGQDRAIDRPLDLLPPLALKSSLLFVDRGAPQGFLLDTSEDPLPTEPTVVELPSGPSQAVRRNGADEALVLCLGRRADSKHDEEPAALAAVGADGSSREYTLGNPFDRISQSEDGRYAFLFKSKGGASERLLENPNEIALVDLNAKPGAKDAVTLRTLRSFGDSPDAVVFSPEMAIADEERRLAVVLSGTNVTLIDLNHLDRRETTVQLDGANKVTPEQVLFNPDAPELYVRGEGSADVFVFNLSARAGDVTGEDGELHNDFRPFIDQLGVGGAPSDMSLYGDPGSTRLLVLANNTTAAVVEASTSHVTSLDLPSAASRILLFDATSPRDDQVSPRALLYTQGQNTVMFLDLADVEERGSRNLESLTLPAPVQSIVPMLDERRALVIHGEQSVSLIDLAGRTVSPISSSVVLNNALFDEKRQRLWVGPSGQRYVGWLELDSGKTPEVLLDHDIQSLVPLFESNRLAVVHKSTLGLVTVLDADHPTRERARSTSGFFAAGLLDRGE